MGEAIIKGGEGWGEDWVGVAPYYCLGVTVILQTYLSEEEFQKVLGVTIHEFKSMPKWKQNDFKKKAGLF